MTKHYTYNFNTDILPEETLKFWVVIISNYFDSFGVKKLKIIFGWHDKLPDKGLPDKEVGGSKLEKELLNQIELGNILLGKVDFWIESENPDISIQFCNDRDIHVSTGDQVAADKIIKIWEEHQIKFFNNSIK
jgi:hypothetical protein